jgi:transglutaminase-like putative cysteine protease
MNSPHPPLVFDLPNGDAAVPFTLAIMRRAALDLATKPDTRRLAALIRNLQRVYVPTHYSTARGAALRLYVVAKNGYRFKSDPRGVEMLRNHAAQARAVLLGNVALGDCDDLAVMLAALLEVLGLQWRFAVVSATPDSPWAHVFVCAWVDGDWLPIDPQETQQLGERHTGGRYMLEDVKAGEA